MTGRSVAGGGRSLPAYIEASDEERGRLVECVVVGATRARPVSSGVVCRIRLVPYVVQPGQVRCLPVRRCVCEKHKIRSEKTFVGGPGFSTSVKLRLTLDERSKDVILNANNITDIRTHTYVYK